MSPTNCPICNRVLVQKSDQTQTCMFCGWSSAPRKPKTPTQTKQTGVRAKDNAKGEKTQPQKKPQEKIITSAEEIARQQLLEENSKLQVLIASLLGLGLLGLVMFQTCQPKQPAPLQEISTPPLGSPPADLNASASPASGVASPSPSATFMTIPAQTPVSAAPSPTEVQASAEAPAASGTPNPATTAEPSPSMAAEASASPSASTSPSASAVPSASP